MSTNHNRIKVVDLEKNQPNKILKTNQNGELEFSDSENNFQPRLDDANFGAFQNTLPTTNTITDTDKIPFLIGSLSRMMTWANFKSLFKTVGGNSIFGTGNIVTADMDTTTTQTVSGVKTFLNLKLGLRNVANTFTSFITNIATASRTWTFPDKSGTVAMTSDITSVINAGTSNQIPKYVGSTVVGNSRILDDGSFVGIGVSNAPTKDLTLGNQNDREIGVEESNNTTIGRDLIVSAGRTINYAPTSFFDLNTGITSSFKQIATSTLGNTYVLDNYNPIFEQIGGTGTFTPLFNFNNSNKCSFSISPTNKLYIVNTVWNGGNGNVVSKANITGTTNTEHSFDNVSTPAFISCHSNGNVYLAVSGGGILMQTNQTGAFNSLGQTSRTWTSIKCMPNGDVYATVSGGDIYKQTAGTGNFIATGQTSRSWTGITGLPSGDIFACVNNGDIYKQTAGTGNFIATGQTPRAWTSLDTHVNGNIYATVSSSDVFYLAINQAGVPNLDGGTYKIKSGTGKGTGKSRVEFYTGQKLTSGTDMQVETMRVYLDENGSFVYLTPPSYSNDADADADANLPSKAFYKITGNRALFQKP
ncbi:hypothetical protein [Flavobacterium sp. LC2016-01]|uniref:hypothetical protein n=1 Tax=Flavobacterium sp. LC2016-01 TaxID=2675876 RepID=UPI0012BB13E2|nr:hypothetical protein [Flavobacterium sp. LC2016-01]MTH18289.1 hypothetical protein [Flavobacterium sp. LC2016-01]